MDGLQNEHPEPMTVEMGIRDRQLVFFFNFFLLNLQLNFYLAHTILISYIVQFYCNINSSMRLRTNKQYSHKLCFYKVFLLYSQAKKFSFLSMPDFSRNWKFRASCLQNRLFHLCIKRCQSVT